MKTIYRAEDGNEFDSKNACETYESRNIITEKDLFAGAEFSDGSQTITLISLYPHNIRFMLGGCYDYDHNSGKDNPFLPFSDFNCDGKLGATKSELVTFFAKGRYKKVVKP